MDQHRLVVMLDPGSREPEARRYRQATYSVISAAAIAAVALTMPAAHRFAGLMSLTAAAAWCFFLVDWVLRIGLAPTSTPGIAPRVARAAYTFSPLGIVDALCALGPLPIAVAGLREPAASAVMLLWLLKAARFMPGLDLLMRVFRNERRTLFSVFILFALVLLMAAEGEYLLEGRSQPATFGTVPRALWWAIVTLTTTGYGDAVPGTLLGRIIAGAVMICGIVVLALLAGILAGGFAAEVRRRDFLAAWSMVARVPFLRDLGASTIAEVAKLLRPKEVSAGAAIMRRGEPGDCMYFIVSGRLEVQLEPRPITLGDGEFVGEMALITGGPRTTTVIASQHSELLALDIADFRALAGQHPELGRAIEAVAARRLAPAKPASGI